MSANQRSSNCSETKMKIPDTIFTQSHHELKRIGRHQPGHLTQKEYLKTVYLGSSYYTPKRGISMMWGFGAVGFPRVISIEDPERKPLDVSPCNFCRKASTILKLGNLVDMCAKKS